MGLILQYLSSERLRILNTLVNDKMEIETFYKAQGGIQIIDDLLGLPTLLNTAKLKELT